MKLLHIITAACANMSNRFGHVMHIKAKRQMLQEIQVKKNIYMCVLNESCLIVIVYCCATLCVCGEGPPKT